MYLGADIHQFWVEYVPVRTVCAPFARQSQRVAVGVCDVCVAICVLCAFCFVLMRAVFVFVSWDARVRVWIVSGVSVYVCIRVCACEHDMIPLRHALAIHDWHRRYCAVSHAA